MNPLSLKLCLAGVFSFNKVVHEPIEFKAVLSWCIFLQ